MSLHPRRRPARLLRRLGSQWHALALLTVVWVMLWGDLSWANVLAGALIGVVVVTLFPLPPITMHGTVRPWRAAVLAGRFVADLFVASFEVAWTAIRPGPTPHGALVSVPLRADSDLFIATTAGLSSLVPGTLVIDLDRPSRTLRLHVLDIAASGGPEGVRKATLDLEARLLRAFAPSTELARVGLAPYTLDKEERR